METHQRINRDIETTAFGGGCFWCTEAVFKMLKGVVTVLPGYAGGTTQNPTYEQVSAGTTGHAEVIYLEYDPKVIAFEKLLTVFFASHDPSQLNRQGNDVGTQYRSVVFYTTDQQKQATLNKIREINESTTEGDPVVTEVQPLEKFYEAEDYHKDYYERNKTQSYCELIINPKVEKIQKEFDELLKANMK